jgi:ribosomal-protein-alanine N-acetyltransferase
MNIHLSPFPTLTTERLILRKLNIQDGDEIMYLRSNDQVNAYIDRDKAITIQDAKDFIKKIENTLQNREGVYWAITFNTNDTLIGTICYYNFDLENNIAEVGYELNPSYHGQGVMQEAINKVIEYGFDVMGLNVMTAFPRIDNESSVKLLKRNGFEQDAEYEYLNEHAGDGYAIYVLKKK